MPSWADAIRTTARRGALVAALGASVCAHASPGDHIRFGKATVVPSLAAGFRFQSNPYRRQTNAIAGMDFGLTPALRIKADGPELKFDLGASYTFQKYLQQQLTSLDRFSDFDIDGTLRVFPKGAVGFKLGDRISLQSRNTDRPGASVAYNNQFRNRFTTSMPIQAGPVLSFDPGLAWGHDEYFIADFAGGGLRPFNFRNSYGPSLSAAWTFFPLTALLLDFDYTWNRWNQNWVPTNNQNSSLGAYFGLPNSQMWHAKVGVRGRLTAKLVVVAEIGYGQAYYDEQSVIDSGGSPTGVTVDLKDARGLLATVQVAWQIGPKEDVKIGYQRNFADSWFTNFLVYDEIYGGFDMRVGSRIGLDGLAKVRFESYAGAVTRNDLFVRGDLGAHYYLQDWASLDAKASWDQRTSTDQGVSFGNFGASLGATFTY